VTSGCHSVTAMDCGEPGPYLRYMNTMLATAPRTAFHPSSAEWSTTLLDELMARVGVDGLVAALRCPTLLATVKGHEAAVQDTLAMRGHAVSAVSLAGYTVAVLTAGMRCGRLLPSDPGSVDWSNAEWHVLRLVAVCSLACELP